MPGQQRWSGHSPLPQPIAQPVEHRVMSAQFSVTEQAVLLLRHRLGPLHSKTNCI